ncbi:hypothetical protein BCR33DRAFT_272315 [Rhizoclosmatium globosum]|uniref:Secreted protein n=1 Tax=Rhizoclosmatium globosum TaxID=329046 RepID=A0A1Y2C854_9FUNG|nr:hypothetical protein BCR33DRAFT_272315 [Rhizoclosmatium globosum]|eukprot:ORY43126.1 hypothetical protein BCR33DRAFT_272315 [Rhizoclosmatium globosum]
MFMLEMWMFLLTMLNGFTVNVFVFGGGEWCLGSAWSSFSYHCSKCWPLPLQPHQEPTCGSKGQSAGSSFYSIWGQGGSLRFPTSKKIKTTFYLSFVHGLHHDCRLVS